MGCLCSCYETLLHQRQTFGRAVRRSHETGKPLLIVGDPGNGCINRCIRTYGISNTGDCVLDLHPSDPLTPSYNLNSTYLREFEDNAYVIFESKTFNFCDNISLLLHNALRVSGGDLFCVGSTTGWCWTACCRYCYNLLTLEGLPLYSMSRFSPGDKRFKLYYFSSKQSISIGVDELSQPRLEAVVDSNKLV